MYFQDVEIIEKEVYEFEIEYNNSSFFIFFEDGIWYAYYPDYEDKEWDIEIIEDDTFNVFKDNNEFVLDNGFVLNKEFFLDLKKKTTNK